MKKQFEMKFEKFQPWSTFVVKTQLPPPILEKMIRITDEIVENRGGGGSDDVGVGQVEDQFSIDFKILEQEKLLEFFVDVYENFIVLAYYQSSPFNEENIAKEKWITQLNSVWINSQKDNEYIPMHMHANCNIASVMYLKIPEFLPSRCNYNEDLKSKTNIHSLFWANNNPVPEEDGAIAFTNNVSKDLIWGEQNLEIQPQVGDFFIFPSSMMHQVYPFRTSDGKGERRSVSINAIFISQTEQAILKKHQEYNQ